MKLLAFLLLAASASGCTPGLLIPGTYAEQPGAHIIPLAGTVLTIKPDTTFTYVHWSDDLSSSRYGSGTYRLAGRQLRLLFGTSAPVVAQTQTTPLVAQPDSVIFTFSISSSRPAAGADGPDSLASVPSAAATGRDEKGHVLLAAASTPAGQARLSFAYAARPAVLQVEYLGLMTWRQVCPATSTAYCLLLPLAQGAPYPVGTTKTFRMRRRGARQLVLSQGPRGITLVR